MEIPTYQLTYTHKPIHIYYFEHATPPVTVLKRLSNNSESSGTGFLHRGIHYPTVVCMRIGLGWLITTSMTVALFREEKNTDFIRISTRMIIRYDLDQFA